MELSRSEKLQFHEDGYVVVQNVVPGIMIDEALHAINHSLGEEAPLVS